MFVVKTLKPYKSWLFRIGLSSFFLANSITAWFASDAFRELLDQNKLTSAVGHPDLLLKFIGINDALLFLLILSGRFRKLATIWGSIWLIGVIYVSGLWNPEFIEHLGILALLLYYANQKD